MKKVICIFLVILTVFLFGCSKNVKTEDTALLGYLEKEDSFEKVVREYGEEASRVMFGEKLMVTVFYPVTEIEALDREIEDFINQLIKTHQEETSQKTYEEPAELTVTYNSFKSEWNTVSVELLGTYTASYLAHPTDIVATFSADRETGETIELDDLFNEGKREEAEKAIEEKFDIVDEFHQGDVLKYWVIENNSLKIILPRGEFLPMSDGTNSYIFTEKETENLFIKVGEKKHEEKTEEEVTANTEPVTAPVGELDPEKKMLALTFDDGPSAHTARLLDIFEKYGGKGTFFVVGNTLDNRKETLKRIVNEGHEIGNHSWSHRQFTNISLEEVEDQIMITRAKIYEITGTDCKIVRPPYGACNDEIRVLGKKLGVSFVNWSVDTLDWKTKNADAVYKEIMKDASDGAIILCHDLHKTTVDAMEKAIPALLKEGYQLLTVTELLSCRGTDIQAGKMYYKQIKEN